MSNITTRFAPSPTGFMHIGSIRTALFAYIYAKKYDGTFILRIENTDKKREVEQALQHITESLQWLGITWNYGPATPGSFGSCIQSERLDIYRSYAEKLVVAGYAYPDPYTAEELQTFRIQAEQAGEHFLYRSIRPDTTKPWDAKTPLRLKVPEIKRYIWQDAVRGTLEAGPEMLDDVILMKADGYPTYNFAHIVDDYEMGVTHVMRGDEFISSMPKFLSIYDALGISYPTFISLPPILRPDRSKKLGKRDGAKDILEYREDGILPETMVNFLAFIGWNPGTDDELFSMSELIEQFSIDKIHKSGAVFNEEKLLWMNKQYVQRLNADAFYTYAKNALPSTLYNNVDTNPKPFQKLLPAIQERVRTKSDVTEAAREGEYDYLYTAPTLTAEQLKWKKDPDTSALSSRLMALQTALTASPAFASPEAVKETVWPLTDTFGTGEVLWPFRISLTGRERSPDPFISAYALGKEETLHRLSTALYVVESAR